MQGATLLQDLTEFDEEAANCRKQVQSGRRWAALMPFLFVLASALALTACRSDVSGQENGTAEDPTILTFASIEDGSEADFEMRTLNHFAAGRRNLQVRYIPSFDPADARLGMYKQLFQERSPRPDICEIDVIWPGMIGGDLLDLTPYFQDEIRSFPPELMRTYTVQGKLIALPLIIDSGLLYYRSDLLRKYGFKGPPGTWDELERMAQVIQAGERRSGDANFWGYVWEGAASEALTCNALEWQASEGGGHIIEPDGSVSVCNIHAIRALERAVSWIGKISPPGVTAYTEQDSINIYAAGHAVFMRNWSGTTYRTVCDRTLHSPTSVAPLPAGASGRSRTVGGTAISVSRYSEHRDEAVAALRDLVSTRTQIRRALEAGTAPTRLALERRPDLMQQTAFHGLLTGQILTDLVARPSVVAGSVYDQVSTAYYSAIHSALTKQVTPASALAQLQIQLVQITKSHPSR